MQIIEITVAADGSTRVETKGFAGASCRQASAFVEQALGQRTGEQLTGEFYTPITQPQTLQEGQ
jgi:hypothetical protein